MRKLRVVWKWGMLGLAGAITAFAIAALLQTPAYAVRPQPDCGPTREWNCVIPGCPDCPEILFEGTVCEKRQFEKATGRVCSPA
jgi:hypothetical protein